MKFGLPVSRHGGGGQGLDIHLVQESDQALSLSSDIEIPSIASKVFLSQQTLDDVGSGCWGAEAPLGHGLTEFFIVDQFSGAFHRGEESRLRVACRRIRFLFLQFDFPGKSRLTLVDGY